VVVRAVMVGLPAKNKNLTVLQTYTAIKKHF
jgi:hypothetical protein